MQGTVEKQESTSQRKSKTKFQHLAAQVPNARPTVAILENWREIHPFRNEGKRKKHLVINHAK